MKKREIYLISVENNIDANYTPRATESEEKAFEIKNEIVDELNSMLDSDCEFNVNDNKYAYKKFTDNYSQYIEVYIECIPVE